VSHTATLLTSMDFTWLDLLDILLVAFIIYELLQFIRGTHAVQMALGGLILVLLYWGSKLLNLETVNWLLRTFMPYLVFGVIVVFQAEIRKVLAHMGKNPFGAFSQQSTHEMVDELVIATTQLASQRIGALMVLERNMGLRTYIETGISLDAILTYDLLVNIFNPKTPLHDGAVVVQGNRITAAACFLPLTVNPELSRTLGSRHRAAIGVTEDTDAVAVVVSEETGQISVVVAGRIERDFERSSLKQTLLKALDVASLERAVRAGAKPLPVREE
jgi:diadenylate cyclase